jgi:AcrR family transcriptional regulator
MDKADGLARRTDGPGAKRGPVSSGTRERLMAAAAELIGELGWGRVTTRAVAERAGLPHGTVSYHFRGKQDLLISAAMWTFTQALPADSFESADSIEALVSLIGDPDVIEPALSRLMLETLREAERDPALGEQVRSMMVDYRRLIIDVLRAEQERGAVAKDLPLEGLGTLLAAVGDGLAVHALLDPDLDVVAPLNALRALLGLPGLPGG